ncbi:hypothetical protein FA15DRAFT_665203 [Coprinopsis marcescibilis]|uniref:Uncharacterized protein n=1 Tax=Coprinopsis marcescibilis TaxID=230819 RepID=A0A5C3L647_COPMA|nr:hypothetical protein FA15DRAFT_665203 [Coprinopsis marcescibilis]
MPLSDLGAIGADLACVAHATADATFNSVGGARGVITAEEHAFILSRARAQVSLTATSPSLTVSSSINRASASASSVRASLSSVRASILSSIRATATISPAPSPTFSFDPELSPTPTQADEFTIGPLNPEFGKPVTRA